MLEAVSVNGYGFWGQNAQFHSHKMDLIIPSLWIPKGVKIMCVSTREQQVHIKLLPGFVLMLIYQDDDCVLKEAKSRRADARAAEESGFLCLSDSVSSGWDISSFNYAGRQAHQ